METYAFIPKGNVCCCVTYVVYSSVIVTNLYELSVSVDQSLSEDLTALKLVKQFRVHLWNLRVRCGYTIGDVVLRH